MFLTGKIPRSPIYLNRNLRIKNATTSTTPSSSSVKVKDEPMEDEIVDKSPIEVTLAKDKPEQNGQQEESPIPATSSGDADKKDLLEELEKKLNERSPPERVGSGQGGREGGGYEVSDETECKFNSADSKMLFTVTKDSYLYKCSAFTKARQVSFEHFSLKERWRGKSIGGRKTSM